MQIYIESIKNASKKKQIEEEGAKQMDWCCPTNDWPVMLFFHQMVSSTEGNQVGIIGWCWDRYRTSTSHVSVA